MLLRIELVPLALSKDSVMVPLALSHESVMVVLTALSKE
jgi:hypothetical protein